MKDNYLLKQQVFNFNNFESIDLLSTKTYLAILVEPELETEANLTTLYDRKLLF